MAATVEQNPAKQVRAAIEQALVALRGHGVARSASLQPTLITAANLQVAERVAEAK
jgi:ABC-type sugar transport system substrate-binding protein